jgi:hypothetical protein
MGSFTSTAAIIKSVTTAQGVRGPVRTFRGAGAEIGQDTLSGNRRFLTHSLPEVSRCLFISIDP